MVKKDAKPAEPVDEPESDEFVEEPDEDEDDVLTDEEKDAGVEVVPDAGPSDEPMKTDAQPAEDQQRFITVDGNDGVTRRFPEPRPSHPRERAADDGDDRPVRDL